MNLLTQFYICSFRPWFMAVLSRIAYSGGRVQFGSDFKTDSVPRIIVDRGCKLIIGNEVEFRRNVEIRVHSKAQVIIGNNCRVDRGVRILASNGSEVELKNRVRIGLNAVLNGGDSITVGEKSLLSGFVYLQTSMHGFASKDVSVQDQGYSHAPVILERNTWLGTHVVVLPGVTIKEGAIVGSNGVVNKDVAAYSIVGGVPVKVISERKDA